MIKNLKNKFKFIFLKRNFKNMKKFFQFLIVLNFFLFRIKFKALTLEYKLEFN